MRINIYGLGYVGSVSAACLAADGHHVLGIDIDRLKVDSINRGESAVVEPGLAELIQCGVKAGRLRATTDAIEDADVSMVCVGTPSNENGSLCLDYVARAAGQIGDFLRGVRRIPRCLRPQHRASWNRGGRRHSAAGASIRAREPGADSASA